MKTHLFPLLILLAFSVNLAAIGISPEEKPNIVFIICDDLNDAIAGMGGHPQAISPNLDKLAESGVTFLNAQTNCPLCGPSRASLWSGLYPHSTGYYGYKQQQNHWRRNPTLKNTVTLFEHLVNNGYLVYATGKIHHNGHEDWSIFKNKDGESGFEVGPSFGPYPWNGDPATNNVNDRGVAHPDLPDNYESNSCWDSFGPIYDISSKMDGKGTWLYNHDGEEYIYKSEEERDLMPDERCAEYAAEILSQDHDKPFFMAVGFNRPHSPCYVPQKYFDMFNIDSLQLAPYMKNDLADCATSIWKDKDLGSGNVGFYKYAKLFNADSEKALLQWTHAYLACIAFVDEQIGEVVEAVNNSRYADNTIIVVTSDHGYHMGEKEYIFKNTLWEESARIPFIVAGKGVAKGRQCSNPISLIDVYPTIVDVCGLPDNPNVNGNKKPLDGNSLAPLLKHPEKGKWDGNDFAITAVSSQYVLDVDQPAPVKTQHYSIRTEKYRYIYCRNGEEELYNHKEDPYEWHNLAGDPKYDETKSELKAYIVETCFPDEVDQSTEAKEYLKISYGPEPRQWLNIYRAASESPTPIYIWAHANNHTASDTREFVGYLQAEGISTISWESLPNIRDQGSAEVIWEDADLMLDWVKKNATTYNLDAGKIIIGGQSRGTVASWHMAHSLDPAIKGIYYIDAVLPMDIPAIHDAITKGSPPIMITYHCTPENPENNIHDPKYGLAVAARYEELGIGDKAKIIHSIPYKTLYDYVADFCRSVI